VVTRRYILGKYI